MLSSRFWDFIDSEGLLILVLVGLLALLFVCSTSHESRTGHERGPCYGNKTCDTGLVCLSEVCVKTEERP